MAVVTVASATTTLLSPPAQSAMPPTASAAQTTRTPPHRGKIIFKDDFGGGAQAAIDTTKWSLQVGPYGAGNHELEYYTGSTSNVATDGRGDLALTARQGAFGSTARSGRRYTSGRIVSRKSFLHGYVEARIKMPMGQGLWPAFWMLGANYSSTRWPACGEIDITEQVNSMRSTFMSIHTATANGSPYTHGTEVGLPIAGSAWHTYAISWAPAKITWFIDEKAITSVSRSDIPHSAVWPFDQPQQIQLNLAVGGTLPGVPNASLRLPATMLVDHVRVYAS